MSAAYEYILFVLKKDVNSQKAMSLVTSDAPIHVFCVDDIEKSALPSWLKGVPTMLHLQSSKILCGTHVLNYLQWLQNELKSPDEEKGNLESKQNTNTTSGTIDTVHEIQSEKTEDKDECVDGVCPLNHVSNQKI